VNAVLEALGKFFSSWKPWVVVAPWERGVRVRLGKTASQLEPGIHVRIPVLDRVLLVNTRLRVTTSAPVTTRGEGNRVRVTQAIIGFSITNPLRALERYNRPESALAGLVQAEMSRGTHAEQCQDAVSEQTRESGVAIEFIRYTDNVEVRAYRLLQASWCTESIDQQHGNEPVVRY
jgi:regulator of protease activity HflC (stomatin/prohibitin superfamily)